MSDQVEGAGARAMLRAAVAATVVVAMLAVPGPLAVSEGAPEAAAVNIAASEDTDGSKPRPWWKRKIDALVVGRPIGVSVRLDGASVYRRRAAKRRIPASNQKLVVAMPLLDLLGPGARLPTVAAAPRVKGSVVRGDLWIIGSGDPSIDAARLRTLARRIARAGITRVSGSVMGSTRGFKRDWWAPGWKRSFPSDQVALPTALTFESNTAGGRHVTDPEVRAARALSKRLRARGVRVKGKPGSGRHPGGLETVARMRSPELRELLEPVLRDSRNFDAEVLAKLLGREAAGPPGSLAKGAGAMAAWAGDRGVAVTAHDGSGLSYANGISPAGLARLLTEADRTAWGSALRATLPRGGQGTLAHRLPGVRVRAKTGTLSGVSALSGWVWLRKADAWASFSIISRGMSKWEAMTVEDAIVGILWKRAR